MNMEIRCFVETKIMSFTCVCFRPGDDAVYEHVHGEKVGYVVELVNIILKLKLV